MSAQNNDDRLLDEETRAGVKRLIHAANELLAADKAVGKLDLDEAMLEQLHVKHTAPVHQHCIEMIELLADED